MKVYINKSRDFAFLSPKPSVSYTNYLPRVKKLSLESYKEKGMFYQRRFEKISHIINNNASSLIEIGAGSGTFLEIVKKKNPKIKVAAVETDQDTACLRKKMVVLKTMTV